MANYVTENNKYVLMTGDADNPLFKQYTGCNTPECLGELYVIARKRSYNPVAVAAVNGNGFTIYTETDKTSITYESASDNKFNPNSILAAFSARLKQ